MRVIVGLSILCAIMPYRDALRIPSQLSDESRGGHKTLPTIIDSTFDNCITVSYTMVKGESLVFNQQYYLIGSEEAEGGNSF